MCTTQIHLCFRVYYIFISLSSYFLLFVSINIELGHENWKFQNNNNWHPSKSHTVRKSEIEKRNKIDIDINLKLISKSKWKIVSRAEIWSEEWKKAKRKKKMNLTWLVSIVGWGEINFKVKWHAHVTCMYLIFQQFDCVFSFSQTCLSLVNILVYAYNNNNKLDFFFQFKRSILWYG